MVHLNGNRNLKNEKHMGDALLQKTYTVDFLTKKQVKNNGEVTQVYVEGSHKGIIDKEIWNAVQEEFARREKFMDEHGLTRYCYGSECNPFNSRVFCGKCGSLMTKHSWKSRGVEQYQCKNHRVNGKLVCLNEFVSVSNLEQGFVKAYNILLAEGDVKKWEAMSREGTPLQKVRGKQMLELAEARPITIFVPELAQLVIVKVTVFGARSYEFEFMDGGKVRI